MYIRITKRRLAAAGLFVLAGVGLASILSPLVGSALATVGQVVNISDHSSSAYFAKVDSSGALKTTAAVTGKVAPALPPEPFYVPRNLFVGATFVLGPTTATVALTDLKAGNTFSNQARELSVRQYSGPAPNSLCSQFHVRPLGVYDVGGGGQTLDLNFQTPIVLKPLASGEAWCLRVQMYAPTGDEDNAVVLSLGGYVLSGSYTPTAPEPAKDLRVMR